MLWQNLNIQALTQILCRINWFELEAVVTEFLDGLIDHGREMDRNMIEISDMGSHFVYGVVVHLVRGEKFIWITKKGWDVVNCLEG
jgi:hypothetical protein